MIKIFLLKQLFLFIKKKNIFSIVRVIFDKIIKNTLFKTKNLFLIKKFFFF